MGQMQRGQPVVRSDARRSGDFLHCRVDGSVLAGCAVVITERDEWANLKLQVPGRLRMIVQSQFVLNGRAVLSVNHEDGLFEFDALDFIRKDGKRIQPKLLQVSKTLRMNDPGVAIC